MAHPSGISKRARWVQAAKGAFLMPTSDGKGLHADAVTNVWAGPGAHGMLAKNKDTL